MGQVKSVGGVFVSLAAGAARFTNDMKKARVAARSSTKGMQRSFKSARKSASMFSGGIGKLRGAAIAAAGPAALGLLIKKAIDAADSIAKSADAIGISTDMLQELTFAADLAGISQDTLTSALKAFTKRVGEARSDTGTLVTILKKMDEELLNNVQSSESAEQAFDLIINAAADMANPLDRAALLAAAFGRTAGVDMANLIKNGVKDMEAMRQKARDLGLVIEEDLLRNAEQAKDSMTILGRVISTQVTTAVLTLAPEIKTLSDNITDGLPALFLWVKKFLEWTGIIDKSQIDVLKDQIAAANEELANIEVKDKINFDVGAEGFTAVRTSFENLAMDVEEGTKGMTFQQIALTNKIAELEQQLVDLEAQEKGRFNKALEQNKILVEAELQAIKTSQDKAKVEKDREKALADFNKLFKELTTDQFELERQQLKENVAKWTDAAKAKGTLEEQQTEIARLQAEERKRITADEFQFKLEKFNELMNAVMNLGNQMLALEKARIQSGLAAEEKAATRQFNTNKALVTKQYTVEGQITEEGLAKLGDLEQGHQAKLQNLRDQAAAKEKAAAKALKPIKVAQAISNTAVAYTEALPNVPLAILIGLLGAAQVATIAAQPFDKGGIVNSPAFFSNAGQLSSIAENRPEGILPLARMANGDLGVQAAGIGGGAGQTIIQQTIQFLAPVTDKQFVDEIVAPAIEDGSRRGVNKIEVKS